MHCPRVEKVLTESHGDEAPIIPIVQAPSADADEATANRQNIATSASQGQHLISFILPSRGVCSTAAPRRESEQKTKVIDQPRVREGIDAVIGKKATHEANRCDEAMP
jgi:hypothetical protein